MLCLIANKTMRLSFHRNVLVSRQRSVALKTAKMFDVPKRLLGSGVFCAEDEFITGVATWH